MRPSSDEAATFLRFAIPALPPPPRILLLGVTPKLHALPRQPGTGMTAAERDPDRARLVWPGDPSDVLHADWRALPQCAPLFHATLYDGGLHHLDHPDGWGCM